MKAAGAKAEAALSAPSERVFAFLLFGPDRGEVEEHGDNLSRHFADAGAGFDNQRLREEDLKRNDMALLHAMTQQSLLGGRSCLRLRLENESASARIQKNLTALFGEDPQRWNPLILEAGELRKASKLRLFFEDHPRLLAMQFYEADARSIDRWLEAEARKYGLALSGPLRTVFLSLMPPQRHIMRAELEKLSLFCGTRAGSEASVPISEDAIYAACSDQSEGEIDDLLDAAFSGELAQAAQLAERSLESGSSSITIARAMQRAIIRLIDLSTQTRNGLSIEEAVQSLRPPVHFRARPRLMLHAGIWPESALSPLLAAVYRLELQSKQTGLPRDLLLHELIIAIAKRARRLQAAA